MGCHGKSACACKTCGPFVIDPRGRFTSLDGAPLDMAAIEQHARRKRSQAGGMGLDGLGRRVAGKGMEKPWRPMPAGMPPESRQSSLSLGAEIIVDAASERPAGPLGAGGDGTIIPPASEGEPLGARPSVPPRLGVDFARIGKPQASYQEPYGLLPLGMSEQQVYGAAGAPFDNEVFVDVPHGDGLAPVAPDRQFLPPLPAPQGFCVVNGFDPRWGVPPSTYQGVVMQFDPGMGAYRFQPQALEHAFASQNDQALMQWFHNMKTRYDSGLMLQPYKDDPGSPNWSYRWIPRQQVVTCP